MTKTMMHLYEVSYSSEKGEGKLRVVASASVQAMIEVLNRKYGRDTKVSLIDQGAVIVSDSKCPKRQLLEVLRDRTEVLADILDAIGKDIAQIETDELLLDKHRKKMEGIARLKERMAERDGTARAFCLIC